MNEPHGESVPTFIISPGTQVVLLAGKRGALGSTQGSLLG
jgi:hypothetical protein